MDTSNKSSKNRVKKMELIYHNIQEPIDEAQRLFNLFGSVETSIIVVNEMIKNIESLYDKGLKNVYQVLGTPNKIYTNVLNPEIVFLKKVIDEIRLINEI